MYQEHIDNNYSYCSLRSNNRPKSILNLLVKRTFGIRESNEVGFCYFPIAAFKNDVPAIHSDATISFGIAK